MSMIKDGGQAFPMPGMQLPNDQLAYPEYGMSLRDYFAAKANVDDQLSRITSDEAFLLGFPMPRVASKREWLEWMARVRAFLKYIEADAMIAAREHA